MRWLLSSWGSRGDLHPFLSLGRGLLARGHEVALLGHPEWSEEVAQAGLQFITTKEPPRDRLIRDNPDLLSRKAGGLVSLKALVEKAIKPSFEPTTDALLNAIPNYDVLVAHHFCFPAPLAAELTKIPFATVTLAPGILSSAYTVPGPNFKKVQRGKWARMQHRLIWEVGKHVTRLFVDPAVNSLRTRYGVHSIPDAFSAHSETLNLQLYSQHFATRPPDWTSEKQYGGFCFYDPPKARLDPRIEKFLDGGEPPVLCTLGSSAVKAPGTFFSASAAALKQVGLRGILLIGDESNRPTDLPDSILAVSEASYSLIMPRVRFVMHQCGIGTLSHALRAGKAAIGFPYAFDQPNNARRLEALKVAEVVLPHQRKPRTIQKAIERLMAGSADKVATRLGEILRAEDGVAQSCEVLERTFAHVQTKK